jgi:hypothetical protein
MVSMKNMIMNLYNTILSWVVNKIKGTNACCSRRSDDMSYTFYHDESSTISEFSTDSDYEEFDTAYQIANANIFSIKEYDLLYVKKNI